MEDYINKLKYMILQAREDRIKAETRINVLQEVLNEYETALFLKEQKKET